LDNSFFHDFFFKEYTIVDEPSDGVFRDHVLIKYSSFFSIFPICFSIFKRRLSASLVHLTVVSFFLVSGFWGLRDILLEK